MAGFLKDINGICSSVLITCAREGNRFPKGGGRRSGTSKRQTVVEIVQNGRVSSTARVSQPVNRNEGVLRVFARVFTRGCDGGRKLRGRTHLASGHLPRVDRGGTVPPPATKRRKGAHVVGTIIRKSMFPVSYRGSASVPLRKEPGITRVYAQLPLPALRNRPLLLLLLRHLRFPSPFRPDFRMEVEKLQNLPDLGG